MNVAPYMRLVPEIEKEIREKELDALVVGMGPSGWLLPWIDRKILNGLRLWGCHDVSRIMPVDDLLLVDHPMQQGRLNVGTAAFEAVVNARPRRLWIYAPHARIWEPHLHHVVASVTTAVPMWVWHYNPHRGPNAAMKEPPKGHLDADPIQTWHVSPVGATSLAWHQGARRIGVLGMDMRPDHHTHQFRDGTDWLMSKFAVRAHELGGVVANLSPISALKKFRSWTPQSESSLDPMPGSNGPAPNEPSNTASEAVPLGP